MVRLDPLSAVLAPWLYSRGRMDDPDAAAQVMGYLHGIYCRTVQDVCDVCDFYDMYYTSRDLYDVCDVCDVCDLYDVHIGGTQPQARRIFCSV